MLSNEHEAIGGGPIGNWFNCWQSLKLHTLQRKDETSLYVKAAKAEKSAQMAYGASLSAKNNGSSAAKLRTAKRSTTIPQGSRAKPPEKASPFLKKG